jgi:hypothetical protein
MPVITTSLFFGILMSIFFKLCTLAPDTSITSSAGTSIVPLFFSFAILNLGSCKDTESQSLNKEDRSHDRANPQAYGCKNPEDNIIEKIDMGKEFKIFFTQKRFLAQYFETVAQYQFNHNI